MSARDRWKAGAGVVLRGLVLVGSICGPHGRAEELPVLSGPAMGTTYRVTLAAAIPGMSVGEVHREVETVLARIDRTASTWRDDSDASRFNRAAAREWVPVSADLLAILEVARGVHEASGGSFDVTVAAVESGRPTGMRHLLTRSSPPALAKTVAGLALDLGGIGPGYAVDAIGLRLVAVGSASHLVELGGEVRAWGEAGPGRPWRVRLAAAGPAGSAGTAGTPREIELAPGEAVATSTCRPGRSPLDPRTGRPAGGEPRSVTARVAADESLHACALADAWAVAAVVLGLEPGADGTIRAPSRRAVPPGATRGVP
jgi:thiamine biosynthesis lipoprotein